MAVSAESDAVGGTPEAAPEPKVAAAPEPKAAAPAPKPRPAKEPPPPRPQPQPFGPSLGRLVRRRLGLEKLEVPELQEIREEALALQRQVVEIMGKEEFTVAEVEKKDIIWRQRNDRAQALLEELDRFHGASKGNGK